MNSDTPETDRAERGAFYSQNMVPTEFARRLELERDEWRRAALEITSQANESKMELKRQLDEARAENEILRRDIAKLDNFLANQDE